MSNYYESKANLIKSTTAEITFSQPVFSAIQERKNCIARLIDSITKSFIKPKPVAEAPKSVEEEIHVFNSFSGADALVMIDDKVVSGITSIKWYVPSEEEIYLEDNDYIRENPIALVIELAVFASTPLLELKDATITIQLCNEYNQAAYTHICGVNVISTISGIDVDTIAMTERIVLSAKEMTFRQRGLSSAYKIFMEERKNK